MDCHSGNRYVAFFDILGFKNWIASVGSKEVFNKATGHLNLVIKSSLPGATVNADQSVNYEIRHINHFFFSDSILFYSIDDSYESLDAFIRTCAEFMNVMIFGLSLMIRGAVSKGEFYVDTKTRSYIGQALIDAYMLEESLDWICVCFTKEISDSNDFNLIRSRYSNLIYKSLHPTKNNPDFYPFAINYANEDYIGVSRWSVSKILDDIYFKVEKQLSLHEKEFKKAVQRIENTRLFFKSINQD
ncbi:MAG: hypothetical protein SFU99_00620 [Saprospiraceae bacterium]|nr:hypothetical protein [Saprospiraceae bacterium]